MLVHERVRAYRQARGITQSHVAKSINVSVKKINAIELGRQKLTADLCVDICRKGFGVEPEVFFATDVLSGGKIHERNYQN